MHRNRLIAVAVATVTMLAGAAVGTADAATTRIASPTGSGLGPCTSSATPCSLTTALASAVSGDTLELLRGSGPYTVSGPLTTSFPLTIEGESGARPVINMDAAGSFVFGAGSDGLTLRHLDLRSTAASPTVTAFAPVTVTDMAIAGTAGCVLLTAANSTFTDSTVTATQSLFLPTACVNAVAPNATLRHLSVTLAPTGVALPIPTPALALGGGGSTLSDSTVSGPGTAVGISSPIVGAITPGPAVTRTAMRGGLDAGSGFFPGGAPTTARISNSLVVASGGAGAINASNGWTVDARNVTAIAHGPGVPALHAGRALAPVTPGGTIIARNTIARGEDTDVVADSSGPCLALPLSTCSGGTLFIDHSNFGSMSPGVNDVGSNQTADPGFVKVGVSGSDYHLGGSSPAIDAGSASAIDGSTDLDGNPRTFGSAPDIGAFERQSPPDSPPAPSTPAAPQQQPVVQADTLAPTLSGAKLAPSKFAVDRRAKVAKAARTLGSVLRFNVTELSSVKLTVQRVVKKKLKTVGTINRAGFAGANQQPFSGKIGRKALAVGSYQLTIVATDAAGNRSAPVVAKFKIVR